ncbi:MAG: hypothetical protein QXF06_03510 [Archaeoglobaceae archaeon]
MAMKVLRKALAIAIICSALFCYFYMALDLFNNAQMNCIEYSVEIFSNGDFLALIPVVKDKDSRMHEVMNNLNVECVNCFVEITESEFGMVLKVVGRYHVAIKSNYSYHAPLLSSIDLIELSTFEGDKKLRVYSNSSVKMKLFATSFVSQGLAFGGFSRVQICLDNVTLKEGWNIVEAKPLC